jgi:2'-5' RNA ligase
VADIRTFVAIHVDDAIIARLAALQQELRRTDARVSWTRPEGMHLTLKFLGDVPEAQIGSIGDALQPVAAARAPFAISIASTGGFPTLRRPRVVWAGVQGGTEALVDLAAGVDAALTGLGFPPEGRPFSPHLTLGRIKESGHLDPLIALLQAHAADQFGEMTVQEILLFQSELSPKGARYTPLRRLALSGASTE